MWIIVKHAAEGHWDRYFDSDPKKTSLHRVYSTHLTKLGILFDIKALYLSKGLADLDCLRLLEEDSSGGYAVCVCKSFIKEDNQRGYQYELL